MLGKSVSASSSLLDLQLLLLIQNDIFRSGKQKSSRYPLSKAVSATALKILSYEAKELACHATERYQKKLLGMMMLPPHFKNLLSNANSSLLYHLQKKDQQL